MRTQIVKILFSLTAILVLTGITVNAQEIRIRGNIPFDFKVGNVDLKAGTYEVSKMNGTSPVFVVRDQALKSATLRLASPDIRTEGAKETVLIFNRYRESGGETSTFLSQIWVAGDTTGFKLYKHQAERDAERRVARRDIITIVIPFTDKSAN